MTNNFQAIYELLDRTYHSAQQFMDMLVPKIENATDEHERLYWHHIYEEEEQRIDRLQELLPKIQHYAANDDNQTLQNMEFIYLLQDISLEKFGLHNFEEHLDLALYWFKDSDIAATLQRLRDETSADYKSIKELLQTLNERFNGAAAKAGSTPTDEKGDNAVKALKYIDNATEEKSIEKQIEKPKKRFTVGSLKNRR